MVRVKIDKRKMSKKAQEEMVGFVIIVVLIIIIGVVFLGFSLRQTTQSVQHQESVMQDTMYAMLAYSSCGTDMRELVKDCYVQPNRECDGTMVCEHVEEVFSDILDATLGEDLANSYIHGYRLNMSVSALELIYLEKGNFTGNYFGALIPIQVSGQDIDFNLRYYYTGIQAKA
jgi:hypothetical protein